MDAIIHDWQGKSICDSEYPSHADTTASPKSIRNSEYPSHTDTTTPQKYQATMQSSELELGLPDEAE